MTHSATPFKYRDWLLKSGALSREEIWNLYPESVMDRYALMSGHSPLCVSRKARIVKGAAYGHFGTGPKQRAAELDHLAPDVIVKSRVVKHLMYVNLDHRLDRRKLFEKEMDSYGAFNITRVPAVFHTNGHLGCTQSHLRSIRSPAALQQISHQGFVAIFEDDWQWVQSVIQVDSVLLRFLESNLSWDVLVLSASSFSFKSEPTNVTGVHRVFSSQTSAGYLVNQHYLGAMEKLLTDSEACFLAGGAAPTCALDQLWKHWQKRDRWYITLPLLGIQRAGHSDIDAAFRSSFASFHVAASEGYPTTFVYVILAHRDPSHVVRLIERLASPRAFFLVHVDSRIDKRTAGEFWEALERPHVRPLRRFASSWGSWGLLEAEVEGLRQALLLNPHHVILLSGQDYPLQSAARIEAFLKEHPSHSFIDVNLFPDARRFPEGSIPAGMKPFKGSQWWALSHECAKYVMDFVTSRVKEMTSLRQVLVPDEHVIQTIVGNSNLPVVSRLGADAASYLALHYIDWSVSAPPKLLNEEDLERLLTSPLLFARKFRAGAPVLDLIDCWTEASYDDLCPRELPTTPGNCLCSKSPHLPKGSVVISKSVLDTRGTHTHASTATRDSLQVDSKPASAASASPSSEEEHPEKIVPMSGGGPLLPLNSPAMQALLQRTLIRKCDSEVEELFSNPELQRYSRQLPIPEFEPPRLPPLNGIALNEWRMHEFINRVNPACPRIIRLDSAPAGLGHLFEVFLTGIVIANRTQATLVVPTWYFSKSHHLQSHLPHHDYSWFWEFSGLAGLFPAEDPVKHFHNEAFDQGDARGYSPREWSDMHRIFSEQPCNISVIAPVGRGRFCNGAWCSRVWKDILYRKRTQSLFKVLASKRPPRFQHAIATFPEAPRTLRVVWQVRVGDVYIGSDTAFIHAADHMHHLATLEGIRLNFHVFSEKSLCTPPAYLFCLWLEHMKRYSTRVSVEMDVRESLAFMIEADILVNTGSSFPLVAGSFSPDSQVNVMFPRKEDFYSTKASDRGDDIFTVGRVVSRWAGVARELDGYLEDEVLFRRKVRERLTWKEDHDVGQSIAPTIKDSRGKSLVTIVTAYFPLQARSKHTEEEYRVWYSRFLRISSPVVIYTTNRTYPILKELRGDLPVLFKVLEDVWQLPFGEFREDYSGFQASIDPEKRIHFPELYAIWNSKTALVKQVADENPFLSDYFIWSDIGAFRDPRVSQIGPWPYAETVRTVMAHGRDKILVGEIHNYVLHYHLADGPFTKDFVQAGVFGGCVEAISWFAASFREWHEIYRARGLFVGKEQSMFNALVLATPERFVSIQTFKIDRRNCGDPWFYYIPFFMDPTEPSYANCTRLPVLPRSEVSDRLSRSKKK